MSAWAGLVEGCLSSLAQAGPPRQTRDRWPDTGRTRFGTGHRDDARVGKVPDRLALLGLTASGYHGWFAEERAEGQRFRVDFVLGFDTRPAASSDDLADTVDYGTLADDVVAIVSGEPVRLIETLAQRIADRCLDDPRVEEVDVTVHKPEAPVPVPFDDVTLTIRRTRP